MPNQPMITRESLIEIVKDELTAGMVNLELTNKTINTNIDRALFLSSDYFTYTDFKTVEINQAGNGGGFIYLSDIDNTGNKRPSIVNVFPATNTNMLDGQLLGLGGFYIKGRDMFMKKMKDYSVMINQLSELDGLIGRAYRVVGDKLYVDKYYNRVTVEYVPNVVEIEHINEGSWIMWIIDYTVALSKRQMAQSRGKFVVASNPFTTNAATLLEEANAEIIRLEEILETKGVILASR